VEATTMARRMRLAPHLRVAQRHQRYREAEDPVARSQWQMLWLLAGGRARCGRARAARGGET
jgi:hypothetical protein